MTPLAEAAKDRARQLLSTGTSSILAREMNPSRSRNPSAPYLDSMTIELSTKLATEHPSRVGALDCLNETAAFRLPLQECQNCRGVDHHQRGSRTSSYPRISSARLPSSTGKLAQCSAISSSSSARRRLVRSRRTRTSRSRKALVTASVLVSPVALASSAASRSASGLRILRAIVDV